MKKEEMDLLTLVFNGFTAVGTVGAVIISLFATLVPKKRFKIHLIDVTAEKRHLNLGDPGYDESYLRFDVENMLDVPMQVFDARIHLKTSSGSQELVLKFDKCFVPSKSRYHVKTQLSQNCVKRGVCTNTEKIKVTLGTSFGEKTGIVKNKILLCDVIESNNEYTEIKTRK